MVNGLKRNIWIILYFLFFINIKTKRKKIEKFHLNEIEFIIIAPLLNFYLIPKLPVI